MLKAVSILLLVIAPCAAQSPADEVDALRLGEWRMMGPLPKKSVTGLKSPSVLASKMRAGVPYADLSATHEGPEGMRLPWTQPDVAQFLTLQDAEAINPRSRLELDTGKLEISELLPLVQAAPEYAKNATAFLYLPVYANAENVIPVQCGAEGKVSLWWNGKQVLSKKRATQFNPASFQLKLNVVPGLNHLLVEVENNARGWSFEMQSLRRIDNPRIHRAIDLGVQYLLDRQSIDGSWPAYSGYPNGVSALALYTLVKSGVSPRHESVLKGLEHLRQQRGAHTYVVSLELMAYHAGSDSQDFERIEELAEDLVDWQMPNGLWGYGELSGGWSGDLSNAQYAALGLRAAAASGVQIPDRTWRELAKATLGCFSGSTSGSSAITGKAAAPHGFGYSIGNGTNPTPSMTAAGIGTLAICRANLNEQQNEALIRKIDRAIAAGNSWLGKHWTLGTGQPDIWNYYYVYGLERAGGLADTETFGEHEWYWEGASHLVDAQKDSGGWSDLEQPLADCFALLFLRRATGKQAITNVTKGNPFLMETDASDGKLHMRLSMRPPISLWIDTTTDCYEDIAKVIYWMKPPFGDWTRVEESSARRFAIQPPLGQPGDWSIRADAKKKDGTLIPSEILEFTQKDGTTPERFAYVTESENNLAPAGRPTVHASSATQQRQAHYLTDGKPNTFWLCEPDDKDPFVDVRFRRPRKCDAIKLVLAPVNPRQFSPTPKITQLEVQINQEAPQVISLPGDLQQKAIISFGNQQSISRVRLRVLAIQGKQLGEEVSVGLAELELY